MLTIQEIESLKIAHEFSLALTSGAPLKESEKYFLPERFLPSADAEKHKDGLHKVTPLDADDTIAHIQEALKDDLADYEALKNPIASNQSPTTTKLTQLKSQQNQALSPDAKKFLLNTEYETTLNTLKATKAQYTYSYDRSRTLSQPATTPADVTTWAEHNTPQAIAHRTTLQKNITVIDQHISKLTQKQQNLQKEIEAEKQNKHPWQSDVNRELTAKAPNAKSLAEDIGHEQARAIILAETGMEKLAKIASVNTALTTTLADHIKAINAITENADTHQPLTQDEKNDYIKVIKDHAIDQALKDLDSIAVKERTVTSKHGEKNTEQSLETKISKLTETLLFDPQKDSAFQGGKIPLELEKLKDLTENLYKTQQKIMALMSELNQPNLTAPQLDKITKKIETTQQALQGNVHEVNNWLLRHEHGLLRSIGEDKANKMLQANHMLMDHIGYHKVTQRTHWQTWRKGKEYSNRPATTVPKGNDPQAFARTYGEVNPGAYGALVKFEFPYDERGDVMAHTEEFDTSQWILPLHGINSSDPKAKGFSLVSALEDHLKCKVGSDRFNQCVKFEKDGSITIKWRGLHEGKAFFQAIEARNKEYVDWKAEQKDLEATASPEGDIKAEITAEEDHVHAAVRPSL